MLAAEAISHSGSSGDLIHPIDLDRLAHAKLPSKNTMDFSPEPTLVTLAASGQLQY
jgi:hypothetical protein